MSESDAVIIAKVGSHQKGLDDDETSLRIPDVYKRFLQLGMTSFSVKHVLKGEVGDRFRLEHFTYRGSNSGIGGKGPSLFEFRNRTVPFSGEGWAVTRRFKYLLFLKKTSNGNYQLTGGSKYMDDSVRIMMSPF
ncbi:MAG: hypothetical protein AAGG48_29980 [Planctomycetota bacterium]